MADIESMVRIENHPIFAAISGITDAMLECKFNMDDKFLVIHPETLTCNGRNLLPSNPRAHAALTLRVQMEVEEAIQAYMTANAHKV